MGGGGALNRAAKNTLVKQLKEWRENETKMQKKKMQKRKEDDKSGEGDASMDDVATLEGKFKVGTSKTPSDSEALVAGLSLKDGKDLTSQPQQLFTPHMRHGNNSDDVILMDGSRDVVDHKQFELDHCGFQQYQQGSDENNNDQDYESENNWEISHAIQSSIDDSTNQWQCKWQPPSTVCAAESNNGHSKDAASGGDHPDYEHPYAKQHDHLQHNADNEIIASLSSEMQHQ